MARYLVQVFAIAFFVWGCFAADRNYFIAADEVFWDYAPTGKDGVTGMPFSSMDMMDPASMWVTQSAQRIGREYKKALYREYTDASFTALKERSSEWEHLGYLGPVIRAQVGDTIRVIFQNNAENNSYSMHPHGVFYTKQNEGVPLNKNNTQDMMNGNNATDGGMVPPGMRWTYEWLVPERSGPGPNDPSSIVWLYHSHVDEMKDTNAGLVGPIIISRAGISTDANAKPSDVDKEFVVLFTLVDENESWYLDYNIERFLMVDSNNTMDMNNTMPIDQLKGDPDFMMSNQKHAVNGLLYANVNGMTMKINDTVRWYMIALGSELDLHGIHWHGQTLLYDGHRTDVIELIPASMKVLDMIPDDTGTWMLHCHTNQHMIAGMVSTFNVLPCTTPCPRKSPSTATTSPVNVVTSLSQPVLPSYLVLIILMSGQAILF